MDFKKLVTRYRQFGGHKLVIEYAKRGALIPAIKEGFQCIVKRQSLKSIYPVILRKIEPYHVKQYTPVFRCKMSEVRGKTLEHEHPKVIWWCWLQGRERTGSANCKGLL